MNLDKNESIFFQFNVFFYTIKKTMMKIQMTVWISVGKFWSHHPKILFPFCISIKILFILMAILLNNENIFGNLTFIIQSTVYKIIVVCSYNYWIKHNSDFIEIKMLNLKKTSSTHINKFYTIKMNRTRDYYCAGVKPTTQTKTKI